MRENNVKIRRARENFLETGHIDDVVRTEIAESWRRTSLSETLSQPTRESYNPNVDVENRLFDAAMPVLDKLTQCLGDTSTSIIMTDSDATIVSRWVVDEGLRRLLDSSNSVVGVELREDVAGTNGLGSVAVAGRPMRVSGAEHLLEKFQAFTCVGAPIRNPITRTLEGVLDITCKFENTNSLLLPLILEAANSIEERLYLQASTRERVLLDHFLTTVRRSARPIISLNDKIVISSPSASRMLEKADEALIWEEASKAVREHEDVEVPIHLRDGREVQARCRGISDRGIMVGAVVELVVRNESSRDRREGSGRTGHRSLGLPGLAGRGAAWTRMSKQGAKLAAASVPMLVTGEIGTGKLVVLDALLSLNAEVGGDGFTVFDAALERVDGLPAWLGAVRSRLAKGGGVVAIRHLESLDAVAGAALCSVIDLIDGSGPRLVGTLTTLGPGSDSGYAPLRDRLAVATLHVPALRERLDDIPDLVAALTRLHSPADPYRPWSPDALRALTRMDWPGNVRQLENFVRRILAVRSTGEISLGDLPEESRSSAPRRNLAPLEDLERRAILTALEHAHGNKVSATRALGISRSTLYRKMRAYGLSVD